MLRVWKGSDRRVERTQAQLHGALASLIHEKPYDAIVVKEILARANVGRSTFYSHFRDKDELLERSIRDVLRRSESTARDTSLLRYSAGSVDRILRCCRALFEHIGEEIQRHRRPEHVAEDLPLAPLDSQRWASVHERVERIMVEFIADELEYGSRWRDHPGDRVVPSELLARHVTSTFSLVIRWWVDSGTERDAATAFALFRALVLPVLARS